MSDIVVVGVLSCVGTIVGSLLGILAANKLTTYRISELEKKVDKHNNLVERMAVQEKRTEAVFTRIDELREEQRDFEKEVRKAVV